MFDLEVEVTHPPVDELEWSWLDVHGVDGGIANPIGLKKERKKMEQRV